MYEKEKVPKAKYSKGSITRPLFLRIIMIKQLMVIGFIPMRKGIFIMIESNGYINFLK